MAFLKWLSPFGNGRGLRALARGASGRTASGPTPNAPQTEGRAADEGAPAYVPAHESTAPYLGPNSVSPSSAQPLGAPAGSPSLAGCVATGDGGGELVAANAKVAAEAGGHVTKVVT